ncbi:hypothetical protein ABZP36_025380 [Zizania latifolia]
MSSWSSGRSFDGQNGSSQYSGSSADAYSGGQYSGSSADAYGGGQYEATTGGKKRQPTSRLKKSSGKDDDVVDYTAPSSGAPNASNYGGGYSSYGGYNAGSVTLYSNGATPYGGGYGTAAGGSGVAIPYDGQHPTVWAPQDGTRSPMVIHTREVHVHGAGSKYDGDNNGGERRRSGGFFRPAFEAVGHFVDRRFGLHDKD